MAKIILNGQRYVEKKTKRVKKSQKKDENGNKNRFKVPKNEEKWWKKRKEIL